MPFVSREDADQGSLTRIATALERIADSLDPCLRKQQRTKERMRLKEVARDERLERYLKQTENAVAERYLGWSTEDRTLLRAILKGVRRVFRDHVRYPLSRSDRKLVAQIVREPHLLHEMTLPGIGPVLRKRWAELEGRSESIETAKQH